MVLQELVQTAGELQKAGKAPMAIRLYEDWLKAPAPGIGHIARFNLAVLLSDASCPAEAEHQLRLAIQAFPEFTQAYYNLGLAVERQGRSDEALANWLKVATMAKLTDPEQRDIAIGALNQIGRLQEQLKNYPQAENALYQSLLLKPKQPDALQHWIHLRQKQCKWPVYEPFGEVTEYDMLMATSPLAMLALTDDPLRQLLCAHSFVSRKFNFPMAKDRPAPYNHSKIRIGYVSGDLCTHAVGLLLPEFLEAHDKQKFELYGFDFSVEDGSSTRSRLKNVFDHFFDIRGISDKDAAALVRQQEVDVLIDMHGLSSGARPEIFALRPAPLQMTWLGYIGTTTFPWIDFVVADQHALPPSLQPLFSEKLMALKGSFLPRSGDVSQLNNQPLIVGDPVILSCFNNIYKFKPATLEVWAKVLNQTESVLWLLDDNPTATENVKTFLFDRVANKDQIKFWPRSSYVDYTKRLAQTDLYLDTYPYNAGSTARDVLRAGVPMVSLAGPTFVSRMGLSVMADLGLEELVVQSATAYEQLLIDLITNKDRLLQLKKAVRQRIQEPNTAASVKSMEGQIEVEIKKLSGRAAKP